MGSQSVTDFSPTKKKRIRELMEGYSSDSPTAETQASKIGAAAVGTLGTDATNEFLQALSSLSVETALRLIKRLAEDLKTTEDLQEKYKNYGVGPKVQKPLSTVSRFLIKEHSDSMSVIQAKTDSAFAATDAISRTIIDVVSHAFPQEKEPVEINREKFAKAFEETKLEDIYAAFVQNVTGALINRALDSTRGSLSPAFVSEIKQKIREHFVPEFVERLRKGK